MGIIYCCHLSNFSTFLLVQLWLHDVSDIFSYAQRIVNAFEYQNWSFLTISAYIYLYPYFLTYSYGQTMVDATYGLAGQARSEEFGGQWLCYHFIHGGGWVLWLMHIWWYKKMIRIIWYNFTYKPSAEELKYQQEQIDKYYKKMEER